MISMTPMVVISGSVWPVFVSMGVFNSIFSMISNGLSLWSFLSVVVLIILILGWSMDTGFEVKYLGFMTCFDKGFMTVGVVLVILFEVMLFFGMFWYLIQVSIEGALSLGYVWSSPGIDNVDVMEVPLMISVILLSSGVTVTWAHSSMFMGSAVEFYFSYMMTVLLGVFFMVIQYFEYSGLWFTLSGGVVSSIFYILTFTHGMHVLLGVMSNSIALIMSSSSSIPISFLGVEVVMWYWHFVDVVWLMLFVLLYWLNL
nr:cytochrome oxidase subunit 3 [Moniliformis sp. XH-2020]